MRSAALLVLFFSMVVGVRAAQADLVTYDKVNFEKAQAEGKPVVLNFHATWCPVCRKQKAALEAILKQAEFKNVAAFVADFDDSEELQNKFNAPDTSTVIVFKGLVEKARAVWMTDPKELRELIRKGF